MRVGDVVDGRFVLLALAGAGGMGTVFRALDRGTGATVAVKAVIEGAGALDRFAREAAVLAQVQHPRVVRYVAHGGEDDARYLAMEWLEGEDLAARLELGPLDLEGTLKVARGVTEGLAALHVRGIVHRDVKPSNVFLVGGSVDDVRLLDLGIARSLDLQWSLTATGVAIGTPAYMSPEQARGEEVDARTDLFSLGCLLYECLSGETPFLAEHPVAAIARLLMDEPAPLTELGVAVPAAVEALVTRLLAKSPSARPDDGDALLGALDRLERPSEVVTQLRAHTGAVTFAERRIVSIVLTRPGSSADVTMARGDRDDRNDRARASATRHGARLEILPGGAFLALFTGDGAPTDHAAKAAAFALDLAGFLGVDAIALATGRGEVASRVPVGDVVERAVSLLRGGHTGVILDPTSASLLEGRYEIVGDGERRELLGARDADDERRTLLGRASPWVGREREMTTLRGAFAACLDEPVSSVILITAPPGCGKSRLLQEIARELAQRDDVACVLRGGCDLIRAGAAFGALGSALRRLLQDDGGEGESLCARLHARIARRLPAAEAGRAAELIGESCGLAGEDEVPSPTLRDLQGDPGLLADAIAEAWRAWLGAEAEAGAVVILVEDLHWSDVSTIKVIDGALRVLVDQPLFVVATARPEVHERFPGLWAERGVQELRLAALSRRSAERFVRQILGASLDPALVARIVERAGGHPFLLEELIRAVAGGSSLLGEVPDTVLGMLELRLAALSAPARAALRAASVFGETFWIGGAEALLGGLPLAGELAALTDAELIVRRPQSRFADEREYHFHHALVRDGAYAMLVDEDRAAAHRLAGEWLEGKGDREAVVLAEHFDRGGAPARAAEHYHRAASESLDGHDLEGAIRRAERAIACGREGPERGETELIIADAAYYGGELARGLTHAEAARGRFAVGGDPWFAAISAMLSAYGNLGKNDEVEKLLGEAADACTSPPSDAQIICLARGICQLAWAFTRAEPHYRRLEELLVGASPGVMAVAWIERTRAEMVPNRFRTPLRAAAAYGRAGRAFERAGALRLTHHLDTLGLWCEALTGAPETASKLAVIVAVAERLGIGYLTVFAGIARATALFFSDADEACLAALRPLEAPTRASVRLTAFILHLKVLIAFDAGDLATARARADALCGLALLDPFRFSACGMQARIAVALGEIEAATGWAAQALALADPGAVDAFDEVGYLGVVEALVAAGDRSRAREILEATLHALIGGVDASERWLGRRLNRELVALARELGLGEAGARPAGV